ACALFQANFLAHTGRRLTPDEMKQWLRLTGDAPSTNSKNIGPRPNVLEALRVSTMPVHFSVTPQIPWLYSPGQSLSATVEITDNAGTWIRGTERLRYRDDIGDFFSLALNPVAGSSTKFEVDIPAFYCGESPEFYFEVLASDDTIRTEPYDAPQNYYSYKVGVDIATPIITSNFENGLSNGWSTFGLWHLTDVCAPPNVCEGSKWAYFGDDASCNYDQGSVFGWLTMPNTIFEDEGINLRYALTICHWLERELGGSFETADLYVDGLSNFEFEDTNFGWESVSVDLDFIESGSHTLALYFDSRDAQANLSRGWVVDELTISKIVTECTLIRPCPGDCANGDRVVDVLDLLEILAVWGINSSACDMIPEGAPNGIIDVFDLLEVLSSWGSCDGP
ncbi:MAG: hypothetical protein O7G85_01700, partial [Planctomycetota bacterium]|nr:hypothetical protein [Planctomycetota bacterium]